jgi:rSAM/selenodomain-associated transferase 1
VRSIAVGIICKTPIAGQSKTRLSPALTPNESAALSACFIRDLAATIETLTATEDETGYAVYTPVGSEASLQSLLPPSFRLLAQSSGDFGARLFAATVDLLSAGHSAALLVSSDNPTLPLSILRDAVHALRRSDSLVLGPALDGGYTLVGLSQPCARVFADIPWSTPQVYRLTLERAGEIGLPVVNVPQWYDVDDEYTLQLLQAELAGQRLEFAEPGLIPAEARHTRQFLASRNARTPARTFS